MSSQQSNPAGNGSSIASTSRSSYPNWVEGSPVVISGSLLPRQGVSGTQTAYEGFDSITLNLENSSGPGRMFILEGLESVAVTASPSSRVCKGVDAFFSIYDTADGPPRMTMSVRPGDDITSGNHFGHIDRGEDDLKTAFQKHCHEALDTLAHELSLSQRFNVYRSAATTLHDVFGDRPSGQRITEPSKWTYFEDGASTILPIDNDDNDNSRQRVRLRMVARPIGSVFNVPDLP